MATKQELEAEVAALKAANPDAAELVAVQTNLAQALEEVKKLGLELVTSAGETQLALEQLQAEKAESLKFIGRIDEMSALISQLVGDKASLETQLAQKPTSAGVDVSKADPTIGNVRDLKEKMRRGECHDEQRVILLKD